jgi:hypothetical protein
MYLGFLTESNKPFIRFGYEHQALCSLCLQAKDLVTATIKLGSSDSPTALMQPSP